MTAPRVIKSAESLRSAKNATGTDIPAYYCVSLDTTLNQVVLPASAAAAIAGTTTQIFYTGTGVYYTYQTDEVAKLVAGAAISVGDLVMPQTSGKVITRTGTNSIVGKARTAAAADGDIIEVELDLQTGA